jgi:hypothetical protein
MADLEHATENDTDLHGDTDARHWAERFAGKFRITRRTGYPDAPGRVREPEELMLTWFAGAIETGRMAEARTGALSQITDAQKASDAVYQAIGEASMCWSEYPKGTFDSRRAEKIGRELLEVLGYGS